MHSKVRIGIIGAGRIGRMHAFNLVHSVPDANVVAIADVNLEAAEKCAKEMGIPRAYKDPRIIIEDPNVDAIVISSSTDTHATLIEQSAKAKKFIFCEKPIAFDLKTTDHVLTIVKQTNAFLQIGFNRRFDPSFSRVHDLVKEGKIGIPHIVRITSRDPQPPPLEYVRTSGGMFFDMTIHDFDMARYLIGDDIETVHVAASIFITPQIEEYGDVDTAVILLTFKEGALGAIDNSRQAVYGYDQRVEVFGSKGMALVTNKTPDQVVTYDTDGTHLNRPLHFFPERYREAFVNEMVAFIRSIKEDLPPPVSGEDGRIAAIAAYAARKSLETGAPVRLSEIDPSLG